MAVRLQLPIRALLLSVVSGCVLIGCSKEPIKEDIPKIVVEPVVVEIPQGPPEVSVRELCQAYNENETTANEAYLEKQIELTGRVEGKETSLNVHFLYLGADTSPYLDEPPVTGSVRCEFPQSEYDHLVTLHSGKSVSVIGRVTSKSGSTITMSDCRLR